MKFEKGKSGNPGGQTPQQRKLIEAARSKALNHCDDALAVLVEIMMTGEEDNRVKAAVALLDRGLGKPAQAITGAEGGPIEFARAESLTDDQLAAIVAAKGGA